MVTSIVAPTSPRQQGIFARRGVNIVEGCSHSPRLRHFLEENTGTDVYRKKESVWGGSYRLYVSNRTVSICGLSGLKHIYEVIREERERSGKGRKVWYGWDQKEDWGILPKARSRCVLATQCPGEAEWKLLPSPLFLRGLTEMQEIQRAHQPTVEALTKGLGCKVLRRWWNVISREDKDRDAAYVYYTYTGRNVEIYGFRGYRRVFSTISQEGNLIVARFYKGPDEAKKKEGLIKAAVLSERENPKTAWVPLVHPRIISSTPDYPNQHSRAIIAQVKNFLLADQPEGAILDLEPRSVDKRGTVRFGIDTTNEGGGILLFCGYGGYPRASGRIISENGLKKAYFWPDEKARENGIPPLKPKGHVAARKTNGKWEIVWNSSSAEWREKRNAAFKFGNFLFATVGDRAYPKIWPVIINEGNGFFRKRASKAIRGNRLVIELTGFDGINGQVYTVTRELQGRIKLMEVWHKKEDFEEGKRPLEARFVTFKPNDKPWMLFWSKLDEAAKFKRLLKRRLIKRAELNEILSDPYFSCFHQGSIDHILDKLDFFEGRG